MGVCIASDKNRERKTNVVMNFDKTFESTKIYSNYIEDNNRFEAHEKFDSQRKNENENYFLDSTIAIFGDVTEKYDINFELYLGNGESGIVYRGIDKITKKKYAFKEINKSKVNNKKFLLNEIKYSLKLKNEYIIKIHEIYENKDFIYIVMDYIESGDLFDYIINSPQNRLDELLSINILIQILKAINYLHYDAKLCHRDIKPENILIKKKPYKDVFRIKIKLIDFGFTDKIKNDNFFNENLGTLSYKAPEIFVNRQYNEKVDLFATGIILYNLITGCEPYRLHSETEINNQIINNEIPYDNIKNEDIKHLLIGLCHPDYNKRLNAKQALFIATEIQKKLLKTHFDYISENNKIRVSDCKFLEKKDFKIYNLSNEEYIDFDLYMNIYIKKNFVVNSY